MDISYITGYKSHTDNYKKFEPKKIFECVKCKHKINNTSFYVVKDQNEHYCDDGNEYRYYDMSSYYELYDVYYCNKCYNEYRLEVIKSFNDVMNG